MSLGESVAGSALRQQQQQYAKPQQKCTKAGILSHSSSNKSSNNSGSNYTMTTTSSLPSDVNCLQSSPSSASSKSLLTSPVDANYIGSSPCSSLFSFESGVVLSGSSGCCSLSNSPSSSSSSSNSYLVCGNTSTTAPHLEKSFSLNSCPLNASPFAAVNADLEDDYAITKTLSLTQNASDQKEPFLHTIAFLKNNNDNGGNGDNGHTLLLENIHQLSIENSCCLNNVDARTLQLAVELTMMNLNQMTSPTSRAEAISTTGTITSNYYQQLQSHKLLSSSSIDRHNQLNQQFPSSLSCIPSVNNAYMTTKLFLQTGYQATGATLLNQNFLFDGSQDNIPNKISAVTFNPNQNLIAVSTQATDERTKKSQNMTECVPVPSSEHVAEIVGRQGCKIKALRAKTNTYIKTPVRNEEPVFVVTGRKEDVAKAKREILSAAEHFTLIRATRRTNDGVNGYSTNLTGRGSEYPILLNNSSLSSTTPLPGQVTIQIRVPYKVVGLVVGPKGNTIKHIQYETQTYIVTPSRDKEPIFEVTGMPDNVQIARKQIEAHIATRTGSSLNNLLGILTVPPQLAPAGTVNHLDEKTTLNQNTSSTLPFHSLNTLNQILNDDLHSETLSSIYKSGIGSALEYNQNGGNGMNAASKCNSSNSFNGFINSEVNSGTLSLNKIQRRAALNSCSSNVNNFDFINNIMNSTNTDEFVSEQNTDFPQLPNSGNTVRNMKSVINSINILENSSSSSTGLLQHSLSANALLTRSCSSVSSTASSTKSFNNSANSSNTQFWKSFCGSSPSVTVNNRSCGGIGNVNNDSNDNDEGIGESMLYSWGLPNTLAALTTSNFSPASTSISPTDSLFGEHSKTIHQQQQLKSSTKMKLLEKVKRNSCSICQDKDIIASLLPCGHKMFCYECANSLCQQNYARCPICSMQIYQAVRIQN